MTALLKWNLACSRSLPCTADVIYYQCIFFISNVWYFLQDAIKIDEDLLENSARSLETLVSVGMKLGVATKKQTQVDLPGLENCVLEA